MTEPLLSQAENFSGGASKSSAPGAVPEQEFYNMLMQAPAAIVLFKGPEFIIEFANDLYLEIAGKPRHELLMKPAFEAMPVASNQGFIELLNSVRLSGKPFKLTEHKTLIEKQGRVETTWLNIVYQPLKDMSGAVTSIMILVTDATEQVRIRLQKEEEKKLLSKTKDQLALSISIGNIGIWHWDVKHNLLTWSMEQLAIYGLKAEEFGGRIQDFHRFVLTEDLGLLKNTAEFERKAAGDFEYQFRIKRTDGKIRWIQGRSRSFYNNDGEVEYRTGVNIDITDRKKAEEALRQSEEKFRSTFDNAAVGISHVALNGDWLLVNDPLCRIVGYTKEELLLSTFQHITHPHDLDIDLQLVKMLLAGERESYTLEKRYIHKSGAVVWVNLTVSLMRHADGTPAHFISIVEDISERKRAEEKIIESEERLNIMIEAASLGLWDYDIRTNTATISERTREFYNLQKDEPFTFERFLSVVHPADKDWVAERNRQVLFDPGSPTSYTAEFRVIRRDGAIRWMRSTGKVLLNEKGERYRFSGAIADVTDEKFAAQALQQSETRFRTLAEALPQMVWIMDAAGNREYASPQWKVYSGIDDVNVAWQTMVHPDDWEPVYKAWNEDFVKGVPFRYEVRLKNKAGEYRWHSSTAEPLHDENGTVYKWIGALTDIHEQKTFVEKLEQEVAQRTRELERSNEDLQQFAHVASHDLKEPIRKVRTFGSRLEEECGNLLTERGKLYLQKMLASAERMFGLIDGVLNYSTVNSLESTIERVDLNALLQHIETDLELVLHESKAVLTRNNLPVINGSYVLLNQLFYNLLNNALKFSRPGVSPVVTLCAKHLQGKDVKQVADADREKMFVAISVCDNGIGFKPEYAEMIFKTFTRLNSRDRYEGTGLGLALCQKIVERHRGYIYATGKQDEGACFYVLLPA